MKSNVTKKDTQNVKDIRKILNEVFPKKIFAHVTQREKATWLLYRLASVAFLWMTCGEKTLTDGFELARNIFLKVFPDVTKIGTSYQGFTDQLARYQGRLMEIILPHLRNLTKTKLKKHWLVSGHLLLAVDGTRNQLAWTKSLKEKFASPKKKKKQTKKKYKKSVARKMKKQSEEDREKKAQTPQLWLTLLWHVGTGLPYNWRIGPGNSSERAHALEMLKETPKNALIVGDAGFIGYEFWSGIMESKKHFLVRVGGNVKLLRKLGFAVEERDDMVYLWPDTVAKKNGLPLVLRLIKVSDGRKTISLVTDIMEEKKLSSETALEIYKRRWGIEVFFRTLKQTYDRTKLRSSGPTNAPLELEWSLVSLWVMLLYGEESLLQSGISIKRLSPAKVIRAFERTERDYRCEPASASESLWERLSESFTDDYKRAGSKTNRSYPRKNQRKPPSEPKLKNASKTAVKKAKNLKNNTATYLTA